MVRIQTLFFLEDVGENNLKYDNTPSLSDASEW